MRTYQIDSLQDYSTEAQIMVGISRISTDWSDFDFNFQNLPR